MISLLCLGCEKKQAAIHIPVDWQLSIDSTLTNAIQDPEKLSVHQENLLARLQPLVEVIHEPAYSDWLSVYPPDFQAYGEFVKLDSLPINHILITSLDSFTRHQQGSAKIGREYLEAFFGIKTTFFSVPMPLPATLMRRSQLDVNLLVNDWLPPQKPSSNSLWMAITAKDLKPHQQLGYAFGMANHSDRVAAISLFRLGEKGLQDPQNLFLKRMLKLLSHETGHLLGIAHCAEYQCNMNGVNHLKELDKKPVSICPTCLAKLSWKLGISVEKRFERLREFWKKYHFRFQEQYYRKAYELSVRDSL